MKRPGGSLGLKVPNSNFLTGDLGKIDSGGMSWLTFWLIRVQHTLCQCGTENMSIHPGHGSFWKTKSFILTNSRMLMRGSPPEIQFLIYASMSDSSFGLRSPLHIKCSVSPGQLDIRVPPEHALKSLMVLMENPREGDRAPSSEVPEKESVNWWCPREGPKHMVNIDPVKKGCWDTQSKTIFSEARGPKGYSSNFWKVFENRTAQTPSVPITPLFSWSKN